MFTGCSETEVPSSPSLWPRPMAVRGPALQVIQSLFRAITWFKVTTLHVLVSLPPSLPPVPADLWSSEAPVQLLLVSCLLRCALPRQPQFQGNLRRA